MRQLTDSLVWLAVIGSVAAVVYFTPRLADYVATRDSERGRNVSVPRVATYQFSDGFETTP
jgi:hypothetical protein